MNTLQRPTPNGRAETVITSSPSARPAAHRRFPWRLLVVAALIVALVTTGTLVFRARAGGAVAYDTVPVAAQTLVQTVSATGTVNAQNTISVGTQASGTISEIDVDYNSKVRRGQVLAKLDPTAFQATLAQAQATLAQAQAQAQAAAAGANGAQTGIAVAAASQRAAEATVRADRANAASNEAAIATADAGVTKAQSALAVAQQTVNSDRALLGNGYIAQNTVTADQSNLVAAQTAVQGAEVAARQARMSAEAGTASADAGAAQAQQQAAQSGVAVSTAAQQEATAAAAQAAIGIDAAQVKQAEDNLSHTIITSPVDGTVVARSVSVGQTVAASFQTPTLFSIAQDLNKMEVDLAVGEPDIGSVKAGETVDFSVLAYPNRTFTGTVSQVRLNATTTNNVVTYTAVVLVGNRDGALLPGMTANATIDVATAPNALVVPLAALTYVPSGNGAHRTHAAHARATNGAASATGSPSTTNGANASPWGVTTGSATALVTAGSHGRIFVERNGSPARVPVTVRLVAGTQAAVTPLAGTLAAGDAVVVGDSSANGAGAASAPRAGAQGGPGGSTFGALRGIH